MKHFVPDFSHSLEARVVKLERQLARERSARLEAEAIAERGLRALYEQKQWLLLLQQITKGANEADNIAEAFALALREVCTQMGWDFGNAYLVESDTGDAQACDVWYADEPDRLFAFIDASRQIRFAAGTGLPGRVLRDGQPHWILDVRDDEGFLRRAEAKRCGIRSGCAFPIVIKDQIVALFEFFSARRVHATDDLLGTMAQISSQLGRVVERDRARRALLHDASHDALTGLPNRVLLAERCARAAAKLPASGEGVGIVVIDLDGFKAVNDRFGHHAGDSLIRAVGERLRAVVELFQRDCDPAWPAEGLTLSRTGGDEFVVLLDGLAERPWIDDLTGRIHKALERPFYIASSEVKLAASIGLAISGSGRSDVHQLLRDADLAMYEAKAEGRGRTVEFNDQLGEVIRNRRQLEHELRLAIRDCQFRLFYQPIIDMQEGSQLQGYEALVRWQHPERGLVSLAEFIPIAEEAGLMSFIGGWVLHEACDALARLHAMGEAQSRRFISINVAPMQFLQPNFTAQVRRTLMRTGVRPEALKLEITEGVAIIDPVRTAKVLAEVREWGVQTSLDDFGSGYSSLSYLQNLPFDTIKIDKSFIDELTTKRSQDIVRTILELARSMDLSVIAEGIENEAQRTILEQMGCPLAQGYLYGRPVCEEEAFAL